MSDRPSYKTYQGQLQKALKPGHPDQTPLLVIKGGSDFMLSLTLTQLKAAWAKDGWEIERVEGPSFTAERFLQATSARSLFEPRQITLVQQAFANADVFESLKTLSSIRSVQPALCLVTSGEVPAKFQKELTRLGAFVLSCDAPAPWEAKDFLVDRARVLGLQLDAEAITLTLDATGSDLIKIENELKKFAMLFGQGQVKGNTLAGHLDFLREDNAFKVDQLLCQEAYGQALLLLKDLLDRGESGLAVLAVLAMHCRKALQIQAGLKAGSSPADLSRELRLPLTVVQNYLPYLRKKSATVFQKALNLCHEADRRLKSVRHGHEIWLDRIVWELREAQ